MRIAIVHPWYLANGGAEQTVSAIADLYPEADLFTLFYDRQELPENLRNRSIQATSLNWLPAKYKLYRYFLPAYPLMFESLDLRGYDLVISSDSCVTKGILTDQNAVHVCYCHSPMRCLWDMHREFACEMPSLIRPIFTLGTHYVRQWDFSAAQRVGAFVANSHNIAERIRKFYNRESTVIYPPVNTSKGYLSDSHDDFYLSVGRLTDLKRVDLLIAACNQLKRKLVIVGGGRDLRRLEAMAGPTIHFAGRVSDQQLSSLYARCRAFLFAANEDFGIVPVEAQSYGRPVIAYGKGGSLETVIPPGHPSGRPATGLFFEEQAPLSIERAIRRFEQSEHLFIPEQIQKHAREFDSRLFGEKFTEFVSCVLKSTQIELPSNFSLENAFDNGSYLVNRGAQGMA